MQKEAEKITGIMISSTSEVVFLLYTLWYFVSRTLEDKSGHDIYLSPLNGKRDRDTMFL